MQESSLAGTAVAGHSSDLERARIADLLSIVPKNRHSVLDIGARDGVFSGLLRRHFAEVTALDLECPAFDLDGVRKVQGDVTRLDFPDNSFDVAFCVEVLEHVPKLEQACREIRRVVRHEAVIGVPYKQDLRLCRNSCQACGRISPPWGHVNSFDEAKLERLFAPLKTVSKTFVGISRERTNRISVALMDFAGNPWGVYDQLEPCPHCGAKLERPTHRSFVQRLCSAAAHGVNVVQSRLSPPHAEWIHILLQKSA